MADDIIPIRPPDPKPQRINGPSVILGESVDIDIEIDSSEPAPVLDMVGRTREIQAMKVRLAELEIMYATRFRHQVPTQSAEAITKHGYGCGFHPQVLVSDDTSLVECRICGEALEPIDVLREIARGERNFAHQLEHLRTEKDELVKEIEVLKRQRANHKQALRRTDARKGP